MALPVYGWSAAVVALVGSNHVHVHADQPTQAALVLVDFRRTDHTVEGAPQVHTHALFQRHHHAAADRSVRVLGAADGGGTAAADDGAASAGGAALVWGLVAGTLYIAPRSVASLSGWGHAAVLSVDRAGGDRLERPPRCG